MIHAILWDNDGVLVDTEGLYFQAGREIMATQGIELTQEDFVEQSLQKGRSVFDLLPNQACGFWMGWWRRSGHYTGAYLWG